MFETFKADFQTLLFNNSFLLMNFLVVWRMMFEFKPNQSLLTPIWFLLLICQIIVNYRNRNCGLFSNLPSKEANKYEAFYSAFKK